LETAGIFNLPGMFRRCPWSRTTSPVSRAGAHPDDARSYLKVVGSWADEIQSLGQEVPATIAVGHGHEGPVREASARVVPGLLFRTGLWNSRHQYGLTFHPVQFDQCANGRDHHVADARGG
jgi:hypothetical protein